MAYVTYRKFTEAADMNDLAGLLKASAIEYEVTEGRDSLDSLYGDRQFSKEFYVKIRQEDFATADALVTEENRKALSAVDASHYLFGFTDEELFDILVKPDEWSDIDYQLACKILRDRGRDISDYTLDLLRKQRVKELAKPEESQKAWIYGGYIMAFMGGLLGIFIGWHLGAHKKTLPNGQTVYAFKKEDRQHGWRIVMIGVVMFILVLILRLMSFDY